MCIVANSGSLTREPTALLSARQPKPLQHLFVGIPLKRFALRFAEGQGQAGVVCGTVEEQVKRTRKAKLCRHPTRDTPARPDKSCTVCVTICKCGYRSREPRVGFWIIIRDPMRHQDFGSPLQFLCMWFTEGCRLAGVAVGTAQ